jgi:hypothetical protein
MTFTVDRQTGELRRVNGRMVTLLQFVENDRHPVEIRATPPLPAGAEVEIWFAVEGQLTGLKAGEGLVGEALPCSIPQAGQYFLTVRLSWAPHFIFTSRSIPTFISRELIPNSEE